MFPSDQSTDLDAQARAWFARQQSHTLSENEQQALAEWLAANPDHYAAWQRVEQDWQTMDHFRYDLAGELNKARRYRPPQRQSVPEVFKWTVAALVLVALLPFFYFQGLVGTTQSWHTAVGERRHVELADGTLLSLDTATQITVTHSWFKRLIRLQQGEIYLDVAADWRPLRVTADNIHIRDIGTRFSVRNTADQFRVQVAEGAVEVKDRGKYALLQAGEMLTHHAASDTWQLAALPSTIANWRQGLLIFNEHPLLEVLDELARYHAVRFDLTDPGLGDQRVSGRFQLDELHTNLRIIAETLQLNIEQPRPDLFILRTAQK